MFNGVHLFVQFCSILFLLIIYHLEHFFVQIHLTYVHICSVFVHDEPICGSNMINFMFNTIQFVFICLFIIVFIILFIFHINFFFRIFFMELFIFRSFFDCSFRSLERVQFRTIVHLNTLFFGKKFGNFVF